MTEFEQLKLDIEKYVRSGMTEANRNLLIAQAGRIGINAGQLVMLIKNAELEIKFATGVSNTDYPDDAGSGFLTAGAQPASGFVSEEARPDPAPAADSSGFVTDNAVEPEVFTTHPEPSQFSDVRRLDQTGAMADVYSALHEGRRKVIIKRIKPQYRSNPNYVDLFYKEFDNGYSLNHNNIVRFHGKGEDSEGPFYYMEYVDGRTLTEFIHTEKVTDPEVIRKILLQILDALSHMHQRQIFHRDLKPDNIMLTNKGNNVKIIDFGLAAADSIVDNLVKAGTPRYAAPELMTRASLVDQRSDIYSLGMIIIEIFTGVPNRHNLSGIPHELFRCMADKATMALPDHRYQSCDEMIELLQVKSNPIPKWLEDKIKEYASDGFISRNERLVLDKETKRAGADKELVDAMITDEIEKAIERKRRDEVARRNSMALAKANGDGRQGRSIFSKVLAWLLGIVALAVVAWALYMIFGFKVFKTGDDCATHPPSGQESANPQSNEPFVLDGKVFRTYTTTVVTAQSADVYDLSMKEVLMRLPKGTSVTVLGRYYNFVKVNVDGKDGYVAPSQLSSCK